MKVTQAQLRKLQRTTKAPRKDILAFLTRKVRSQKFQELDLTEYRLAKLMCEVIDKRRAKKKEKIPGANLFEHY